MRKLISEMIETPEGEDYMLPAFLGCVTYIYQQAEARALFLEHTGIDIADIVQATGIKAMVDEATGHAKFTIIRFLDWVVVHHWGREPGGKHAG